MSIPSNCLLCNADADHQSVVVAHVYGDENRAVFHCSQCDVRYQYPPLTKDEEAKFYASEFQPYMARRSNGNYDAASERERKRRMGYLSGLLKGKKHILEIGCGSGFMLYPLHDGGQNCVGVEPSGLFLHEILSHGIECHKSLDQVTGKFDLIMHYYVMEHLSDPVVFLKQQVAMLNPGGHIVFEVPNVNDALTTVYKIPEYDRFIWQVAHRWYFSAQSLGYVLGAVGADARVELDQRYDLSNHMVWARDGKPGGMGRFTDILGLEIETQYRQTLIAAGRCDTLIGKIEAGG